MFRTLSLKTNVRLAVGCTAVAVTLAGCGGGSSHAATTPSTTASTTGAGSTTSSQPTPIPQSGTPGPAVAYTAPNGYQYQVALDQPGVTSETSTTTDDSSGTGSGTSIDATPGDVLLTAKLSITNSTDRPEPMPFVGLGPLPFTDFSSILALGVPRADATRFGFSPSDVSDAATPLFGTPAERFCGDSQGTKVAPVGYCSLGSEVSAFSPAQSDLTTAPQLAPGAGGTITIIVQNAAGLGGPVPAAAPVGDVKVMLLTALGPLSSPNATWALLAS